MLKGSTDHTCCVAHAELIHNIFPMTVDGLCAEIEFTSDLFGGVLLCDEVENFFFSGGDIHIFFFRAKEFRSSDS